MERLRLASLLKTWLVKMPMFTTLIMVKVQERKKIFCNHFSVLRTVT